MAGYDYIGAYPSGNADWRIEKRNLSSGTTIWAKTSDPSSGQSDAAYGVAVDGSGVYVVGYANSPADYEWGIEKRNPSTGAIIWSKTSNPSTGSDAAYGVAVDATGVYVVGGDRVPVNAEWRVEKRNPGSLNSYKLWVTVEPTGGGTVKLSPAGTACPSIPAGVTKCAAYTTALSPPYGPTVSFTATPAPGYYFVGWALNGSYLATGIAANNPDSWVMNASYALTAYFQAEPEPMGQNQWVRYPGNPVLTANPNSSAWDNDEVGSAEPFLFPNGTFGMAYDGCCYNDVQIGLATSPDGSIWTKVSNVTNNGPILTAEALDNGTIPR